MNSLMIAFITGVTTGGLSCLAVQGGLLTTALAPQVSQSDAPSHKGGKRREVATQPVPTSPGALPILLFLAAKLIAYTLLGLLLGALGSMLQLTPFTRALLLIAIGIFMVGNGLRMLNVHPIFRHFVFEPPAAVTRYLRRKAKAGSDAVTPLLLGALTVLIPCGVTQAMMALAMGTGNELQAAGLMASFTLGSSVVFFAVVYLATRMGALLEKNFARAVAIVLLILGLVSVDSGLNLMGSPVSFARLTRSASAPGGTPSAEAVTSTAGENEVRITVLNNGYTPVSISARPDIPTRLTFVTNNVRSCSLALVIPELRVEKLLPPTGEYTVEVPPQPAGKVLRYSCSMGMYSGQIVFDQ
ncbi:MAG TPA: sulfite exporter TauE/SafE family protein [Anaerolineae bacterium]|nr:sulfite exporter TauE/SafE family protein [Anaerolineae bacterium]HQI87357.1 sulfite exporter TauE/SafE family protein [Anaerolineae bacterium]